MIKKRQSLMTTYLFYHLLSLMGKATPYYITQMETRGPYIKKRINKMYDVLGGIEAAVWDNNNWKDVNQVYEAGPIVSDTHLIQLPEVDAPVVKVRLRMTQGLWRINTVNLAQINQQVFPERLMPIEVYQDGKQDSIGLQKLLGNEYLVTFPGDAYTVKYEGTYDNNYEYFIESQGYYIEWMREEWLKDENLATARKVLVNPAGYLRKMAKPYKLQEAEMEKIFWNSRYTKNEQ